MVANEFVEKLHQARDGCRGPSFMQGIVRVGGGRLGAKMGNLRFMVPNATCDEYISANESGLSRVIIIRQGFVTSLNRKELRWKQRSLIGAKVAAGMAPR